MEIRLIKAGTPEHDAELDLRYRLLRRPLGMPRGSERYVAEAQCVHLVALVDGAVVACVLFHAEIESSGRLLQMAVDEPVQRRGVGSALVRHLEKELGRRGIAEVVLHARDLAVGFYERLRYSTNGAPFLEVGIQHVTMSRRLDRKRDAGPKVLASVGPERNNRGHRP